MRFFLYSLLLTGCGQAQFQEEVPQIEEETAVEVRAIEDEDSSLEWVPVEAQPATPEEPNPPQTLLKPVVKETPKPLASNLNLKSTSEVYQATATYFTGTSPEGGGCGPINPVLESPYYVALNTYNTPGDYSDKNQDPTGSSIGHFQNGKNCGRWVEITLGPFCSVPNAGRAAQAICDGKESNWVRDGVEGAKVLAIVLDSCGDNNAWCRDDRFHIDLSREALNAFTLNNRILPDLLQSGKWNNRKIEWRFVRSPRVYTKPLLGFARDAQPGIYQPLLINHLNHGIHRVEYRTRNEAWKAAKMEGKNGQRYRLDQDARSNPYEIRVTSVDGTLDYGGKSFRFEFPKSCGKRCTAIHTAATILP